MKSLLHILIMALAFALVPAMLFAQAYQSSRAGPPVEQPLVREGTLAIKLVDVLKLGATADEAQAESLLTSAGIAPKNGWIADYPVTPDIADELRIAVADAATSKTLAMDKDSALAIYEKVMSAYNLAVEADTSEQAGSGATGKNYGDSTVVNNYYYNEGPPVVTYYAPPADYAYLYSWVPYPFWWWDFRFPGFFVLVDFHRIVVVNNRTVVVSNHFFNGTRKTFVTVDPVTRASKTSLIGSKAVIGPSVVRNAPSSVFTNRMGVTNAGASVSTSANNRTMPPSHGKTFTAPSRGRMTAPSLSHGTFGRQFGGAGGFSGKRM